MCTCNARTGRVDEADVTLPCFGESIEYMSVTILMEKSDSILEHSSSILQSTLYYYKVIIAPVKLLSNYMILIYKHDKLK